MYCITRGGVLSRVLKCTEGGGATIHGCLDMNVTVCYSLIRYFGAARDLPGVRELFDKPRK